MVHRPVQQRHDVSHHASPIADLNGLLQQLVTRATALHESPTPGDENAEDRQVILDEVVNGVRCLLVRLHPKMNRAPVVLSPREQEIARMVAEGHPNKTIAAVLDISSWTVCTHMRRIFAKLNVRSRAAMVARILEEGTLDKPPHDGEPLPPGRK